MHLCPVCGYSELLELAYDNGVPSYDICPSCGYHFGFDDDSEGITHQQWRESWIKNGMKWWSSGREKPKGWDPKQQLCNIGVFL